MATASTESTSKASAVAAAIEQTKAETSAAKKTTKKTAKKASKKTTPASVISAKRTASANNAKRTIAAISRMTKKAGSEQVPMGFNASPLPVVSSGSLAIDNLIGGNPSPDGKGPICAGYPRQHITEIYGPEASGKTTLALEAIAEVQRTGGVAMFLDFENAIHHGYAKALGVDFNPNKLMLYAPESMEQGLDMMAIGIKAGVDLIVVDSVAAMVPDAEMAKNFSETAKIGAVAKKLAESLPKIVRFLKKPPAECPEGTAVILINQNRATINSMGGGESTSGGKALKYFGYLRIQANRIQQEWVEKVDPLTKKKTRIPYSNKTQVKIVKSKVDAKQGQTAIVYIRFGQGIDDYLTTIETAASHKLISKSGAFYTYGEQKFQGKEKFRNYLKDNEADYDKLKSACLKSIRNQILDIDPTEDDDIDDIDALVVSAVGDLDEVEDISEENILLDDGEDLDL